MSKGFGCWAAIGWDLGAQRCRCSGPHCVAVDNEIHAGVRPNLSRVTTVDMTPRAVVADLCELRGAATLFTQLAEDASHAVRLLRDVREPRASLGLRAELAAFSGSWTAGLRVLVADLDLASECLLVSEREYLARDDDVASRLRVLGRRSIPALARSFVG